MANKGVVPWNKGIKAPAISRGLRGRKLSSETREKISTAKTGRSIPLTSGSNHWNWKGDTVGYSGVHKWIKKQLGNAQSCENCFTNTYDRFEWANISGEYRRDTADWVQLCVVCHDLYDGKGFYNSALKGGA